MPIQMDSGGEMSQPINSLETKQGRDGRCQRTGTVDMILVFNL